MVTISRVSRAILNHDSHAPLSQGGSAANAARAGVTRGQTLQGCALVTTPRAIFDRAAPLTQGGATLLRGFFRSLLTHGRRRDRRYGKRKTCME